MHRTISRVAGVVWMAAILAAVSTQAQITLYVSETGNDAWSGRRSAPNDARSDGPLASLTKARDKLRELRFQKQFRGSATIQIQGVLRMSAPLVLTPDDSGTPQEPVAYTSYPGARAVLSGGREINGWKKGAGPLWTVDLPEVQAGSWYFRQLFINDRRATRARSPNSGYFHVEGLVDPKPAAPWNEGVDRFRFQNQDLRAWPNLQDVEVVMFHSWNTSRMRMAAVDPATRTAIFTGKTIFRPLGWDPEQRYYVENAPDALDAPGEWFLDRARGRLSYWPLPGEDPTGACQESNAGRATNGSPVSRDNAANHPDSAIPRTNKLSCVAPVLGELVRLEGDIEAGRTVHDVRLVGLSFQHSDWSLGDKGYGDPQAAVTAPAAISATAAQRCTVANCEIAHVGAYGLWFGHGCQENRIVDCEIHDLGAGAIRLGEPVMPKTDAVTASHNLISNNYLYDGGHVYAGAVGLWLAQASHNEISHNEIHSFDYSGMSLGWNWNDAPTRTLHNHVEYNHIHHVVRGRLSDAGGIYCLGTQTGTVLRENLIHDVFPYQGAPAMAWGLYFDQGSNGIVAEKNIVYNTLTGGIMNTGTHGNQIRNNIFACSAREAAWRWNHDPQPPATTVERNIFYLTQGDLFHADGGRNDAQSPWDYNLYWRTDGQTLAFYDEEFAQWQQKGLDRHGLVADPRFVDAAHFDFRLQPDSPAFRLGFEPLDMHRIGLQGRPEWKALPAKVAFPPTVLPPAAEQLPAVPIDDGFETTPVGQPPAFTKLIEEGAGDSIRVTDRQAASGKRSLLFTDAPNMQHSFNPHLYYQPRFRQGVAHLSVDLRLEPGAIVGHEWRDAAQPYRVGPSLLLTADGQLTAGGKPLAAIPHGVWFHVALVCPLGSAATGRYDLTLTLPGGAPQVFRQLPCGSTKFRRLDWLGITSLATAQTFFYMDNLKLVLQNTAPAGPAGPNP